MLFGVSFVRAQQFTGGLLIGLNGSQINGDQMAGFDKGGFYGGVFVAYPFNKYWGAEFDMVFTQKGSKRKIDADGNLGPGLWDELDLNYIELPLLARLNLNTRFYLYAGPAVAVLMSNTFYPGGGLGNLGGEMNADFVKKYDFSFCAGVTYNITPHLSGTLRYTNSAISFGTGSYNLVGTSPVNTGFLNIVATGALIYYFRPNKL